MTKKPKNDPMTITEAAAYCKVSKQYLYQSRSKGIGPASVKLTVFGAGSGPLRRVFYYRADLDAWNNERNARVKAWEDAKRAKERKAKLKARENAKRRSRAAKHTMKKAA